MADRDFLRATLDIQGQLIEEKNQLLARVGALQMALEEIRRHTLGVQCCDQLIDGRFAAIHRLAKEALEG